MPLIGSRRLELWLASARIFLRNVEVAQALEAEGSEVVRRTTAMAATATRRGAADLAGRITRLAAFFAAFFHTERFLGDLDLRVEEQSKVQAKRNALEAARVQVETIGMVVQFVESPLGPIVWPGASAPAAGGAVEAALNGLTAVIVDRFEPDNLRQRLQTLRAAAASEQERQTAAANAERERDEEAARKKQKLNQSSSGMKRAENELRAWERACAADLIDADGQRTASETALALREYASRYSDTMDMETTSQWVERFKKLSADWAESALRAAAPKVQAFEGTLGFCGEAGIRADQAAMARLRRASFSSASDYTTWKTECDNFRKTLDELLESQQGSSLAWIEKECKPLIDELTKILRGPLPSAQSMVAASLRDRIALFTRADGGSVSQWPELRPQIKGFKQEWQELTAALAAAKQRAADKETAAKSKLSSLAQAIDASGMKGLTLSIGDADLQAEKDPDRWNELLAALESVLVKEETRLETVFVDEIARLRELAVSLGAVVEAPVPGVAGESLPRDLRSLGQRVALLSAEIASLQQACGDRVQGLPVQLREFTQKLNELQVEDAANIHQQELHALVRESAELAAAIESNPAIAAVALLIRFRQWQEALRRVEVQIRGKDLRANETLAEIRGEIRGLREEGLGGFPEAVLREYWDWIESCCRGAEETRDIVVSWGAAVEAQLNHAWDDCNALAKHAKRFEGEQFWRRLREFDRLREEENLSRSRRRKIDDFQKLRSQFSSQRLPELHHRLLLKELLS